ncbi:hypothetical protein N0V93_002882 [Gnomoniopsis smithogilvyi]|uniref:RING-type domain-containing protein n=1 Tax=Gnomoniopsis smithogilvyi TaxID=1191159 RepID=A0A9W8YZF9_9PEZI|nr:hypothetical protein N0V93_002882 [Gnomoniopsis smithogilvyi]
MSTPYEVEHGVEAEAPRRRRGIDMSTFTARFHELTDGPSSNGGASEQQQHNNPHAVPTPPDVNGLFRLLLSQFTTLHPELAAEDGTRRDTTSNSDDPDFQEQAIRRIIDELVNDLDRPAEIKGVSQEYLDMLERVPKKTLKPDDACPICAENFLDDPYPLVVELRCKTVHHKFDLDCVSSWLQVKGDCPMCRADQTQYDPRNSKKKVQPVQDEEEDEDPDMMYA